TFSKSSPPFWAGASVRAVDKATVAHIGSCPLGKGERPNRDRKGCCHCADSGGAPPEENHPPGRRGRPGPSLPPKIRAGAVRLLDPDPHHATMQGTCRANVARRLQTHRWGRPKPPMAEKL